MLGARLSILSNYLELSKNSNIFVLRAYFWEFVYTL